MKKTKFFGWMLFALAISFTSCTNVNDPDPDPTDKLPFIETFETSLGKFTTQSVSGDQVWAFNTNKYAMITGYVASVNYANEDWLISPEINLAGVTAAKLSFDHVTRYFTDLKNEATVWISENYVSGLPSTATWTQLTTKTFVNASDWTLATSGEISLTAYVGKKVKIAFKYISTANKAGTWEVKNFKVEAGEATVDQNPTLTGDGTKNNPYTVADVKLLNPTSTTDAVKTAVWTKGFIVGYYNSTPNPAIVEAIAPFTEDFNIMLAASATETDKTKMLSIQLPAGAVRTALGLKTTPANFGKEILIHGDILMYNTFPGVKNTNGYWFVAANTGLDPASEPNTTDPNPVISLIENYESFTSGTGAAYFNTQPDNKGWKGVVIQGTLQPDVRAFNNNKYVQFSAHRSSITTPIVQEFWLVSPRLDLTNATVKSLSFDMAGGYFNASTVFEVYVLDSDNPATANKIKLEGWRIPTSTDLSGAYTPFISSGSIDLSTFSGVKRIGFYYKGNSGSGNSTTYQLDNFKLGN